MSASSLDCFVVVVVVVVVVSVKLHRLHVVVFRSFPNVSSRSRMLFPVNVIAQFNEHLISVYAD